MGKDEFLDGTLLKIGEFLNTRSDRCASIGNSLQVVGSRNGTSTAVINEFDSTSFNLSDISVFGNTDVRSVDNETKSIVGNVLK